MDGCGRYFDNIFIELLWRLLNNQAVYLHEITDGFQAKRILDDWIAFYNSQRPHTAVDKGTLDTVDFTQTERRKVAGKPTWCTLDQPQTCSEKQNHFNFDQKKLFSPVVYLFS